MKNKIYPKIKDALLLCFLIIIIQIVLGVLIGMFSPALERLGISLLIISLITYAVVLIIGFKKSKRKFNEIFKFNKVPPSLWLATIIFTIGLVIVISELDNLLNYILPMPELFRNVFNNLTLNKTFFLAIVTIAVIPALAEELIFRGIILDGLYRNHSRKKAIIISALLFGIIHLNPWQFFSAFIIGLILAWICIQTSSILLCIYIHFFNNALYAITARYNDIIPIPGFNSNYAVPVVFQPLWFTLSGLVILTIGAMMLRSGIKKLNANEEVIN